MPKFKGAFKDYPEWKSEFVDSILPNFDEKIQIRLLNEHTPKEVELKNCATVADAWTKLDSKFANPYLITTILIDDYVKFFPAGKTPEAKLVNLRDVLVKLDDDLTSIDCKLELKDNSWLHQKVIKDLPLFFQTEFSKEEDKLIEEHGSRWEALFKYIKNESTKIEIKQPWRLEASSADSPKDFIFVLIFEIFLWVGSQQAAKEVAETSQRCFDQLRWRGLVSRTEFFKSSKQQSE